MFTFVLFQHHHVPLIEEIVSLMDQAFAVRDVGCTWSHLTILCRLYHPSSPCLLLVWFELQIVQIEKLVDNLNLLQLNYIKTMLVI